MPLVTQLVISVPNKIGEFARVVSALGEKGINIKGFSAPELIGGGDAKEGKIRLMVSDLPKSRTALKTQKIRFREESALVLSLKNRPGALDEVVALLKAARVNIKCGYCTPSREGSRAIVVLSVSNTKKALGILRGHELDEF